MKKIPGFHKRAKFITKAKKSILVCSDNKLKKFKNYWSIDCSAATENMLIAARALDLGGCWIGIYSQKNLMEEIKKIFNLPKNVFPF